MKEKTELTHLSLFSGFGGIDLAAEVAGFTTVGQCEMSDYPHAILKQHWPEVPKWRDVRNVTASSFEERTGRRTVDLVSGGFPCQPFSTAGKRRGKEDDRYLWPEMLRVIQELRPAWVLGENVAGFIDMGLDAALTDLESAGYQARAFVLPACGVGAFHLRYRVFIVANHNSKRVDRVGEKQVLEIGDIPQRQIGEPFQDVERRFNTYRSRLCRSLHGLPHGVDRVKGLGNAVVPAQVYPILACIAALLRVVERRRKGESKSSY